MKTKIVIKDSERLVAALSKAYRAVAKQDDDSDSNRFSSPIHGRIFDHYRFGYG